jgi:hypothetical protein
MVERENHTQLTASPQAAPPSPEEGLAILEAMNPEFSWLLAYPRASLLEWRSAKRAENHALKYIEFGRHLMEMRKIARKAPQHLVDCWDALREAAKTNEEWALFVGKNK